MYGAAEVGRLAGTVIPQVSLPNDDIEQTIH